VARSVFVLWREDVAAGGDASSLVERGSEGVRWSFGPGETEGWDTVPAPEPCLVPAFADLVRSLDVCE
jgi:hypothetical protein